MLSIKNIYLGIFVITGSMSLQAMEFFGYVQEKVKIKILQQMRSLKTPKIEFTKPIKITRTPLEPGTLEKETENIIQQIQTALNLYHVGTESIVNCSVIVSKNDYKDQVLEFFKRKKFKPRKINVEVMKLENIKLAVDIVIYNQSKQKEKLPKQAKL
jgi:hypothetical protein